MIHKVGLSHRCINSKTLYLCGEDPDNYNVKIGGIGECYNIIPPTSTGKYQDNYDENIEDLFKLGHEEFVQSLLVRRKRDKKHFVCKKIDLSKLDDKQIDAK